MFHRKLILFEVSVPVGKASCLIIPRLCEGGKIRAILGQFSARELVVFFKVCREDSPSPCGWGGIEVNMVSRKKLYEIFLTIRKKEKVNLISICKISIY